MKTEEAKWERKKYENGYGRKNKKIKRKGRGKGKRKGGEKIVHVTRVPIRALNLQIITRLILNNAESISTRGSPIGGVQLSIFYVYMET